jgi:hypothetical protein
MSLDDHSYVSEVYEVDKGNVYICRRLYMGRNLRNLTFLSATIWKLLVNAWKEQCVEVVMLFWTLLTDLPIFHCKYPSYLLTVKRLYLVKMHTYVRLFNMPHIVFYRLYSLHLTDLNVNLYLQWIPQLCWIVWMSYRPSVTLFIM